MNVAERAMEENGEEGVIISGSVYPLFNCEASKHVVGYDRWRSANGVGIASLLSDISK